MISNLLGTKLHRPSPPSRRVLRTNLIDASLSVPFGDSEQVFTIQFDPKNGEMVRYETDRCYSAKVGKNRWWGDIAPGNGHPGESENTIISAAWEIEGSTPWLVFEVEETAFNADVSGTIRQKGP